MRRMFMVSVLALLAAPFLARVPQMRLAGAIVGVPKPTLSLRGFLQGDYQVALERWLNANFRIRPALIKMENSLNLLVGDGMPERVVVGKDAYLFEPGYISYLNRPSAAIPGNADTAEKLERLTHALNERGIALAVLLSPSKASIYPDKVPSLWRSTPAEVRQFLGGGYADIVLQLRRRSVPFVDGRALLMAARRREPDVPWFPRGGTHWSYIGACEVLRAIVEQWRRQQGPAVTLDCSRIERPETFGTDGDLAQGLNVNRWSRKRFDSRLGAEPVVSGAQSARRNAASQGVLFVGSSFSWTPMTLLEMLHWQVGEYFYYKSYARKSYFPGRDTPRSETIDRRSPRWTSWALAQKLIVLEFNETGGLCSEHVRNFVDDMLKAIAPAPRSERLCVARCGSSKEARPAGHVAGPPEL